MGLLERVSTLIRANINDLVDRAEDPEKLIKQVILDMENQYLQVKTQVAVSIADQHMLEKKLEEAKSKRDLLLARHRRSLSLGKAAHAQSMLGDNSKSATFDRLKDRVHHSESVAAAEVELLTDDIGDRITRLDRDTEVDRLLAELKARRGLPEKVD